MADLNTPLRVLGTLKRHVNSDGTPPTTTIGRGDI